MDPNTLDEALGEGVHPLSMTPLTRPLQDPLGTISVWLPCVQTPKKPLKGTKLNYLL